MAFTYTRVFTDDEELYLKDGTYNPTEHIDAMIDGKLANCKKKAVRKGIAKIQADVDETEIPLTDENIIRKFFSYTDYKDFKTQQDQDEARS